MESVAIVGVGLIGASFGLALRNAGFSGELIGVSSPPAIEAGLRTGAISRAASLEEAANADLVYLAQPVDRILTTIEALGRFIPFQTLVTDAGSTKAAIVQRASACLPRATFLGGHPLAGKEQRGAESADADLFRGRPYVLTPTGESMPREGEFREWLTRIGAKILEMSPQDHDTAVAHTSHLPQLVSTALSATLGAQQSEDLSKVFGPGLLDMTRLALSSPDLWMGILDTNQVAVKRALDEMISTLTYIRDLLGNANLGAIFEAAATFARTIRNLDCPN